MVEVMKFIPTTIIKQQRSNLYKGNNAIQERNQNEATLILTSVRYFPFHKY